jgi:8-oxo-dGTP pyrophosphatase MutT (NUDIX family)
VPPGSSDHTGGRRDPGAPAAAGDPSGARRDPGRAPGQREEDALSCAARELLEETGYRHTQIEFLGGVYTTAGFSNEYVHLFWAGTEPASAAEPEAGIELVRRPFAEMLIAARAGRISDAKTALALLLAEARGVVAVR